MTTDHYQDFYQLLLHVYPIANCFLHQFSVPSHCFYLIRCLFDYYVYYYYSFRFIKSTNHRNNIAEHTCYYKVYKLHENTRRDYNFFGCKLYLVTLYQIRKKTQYIPKTMSIWLDVNQSIPHTYLTHENQQI